MFLCTDIKCIIVYTEIRVNNNNVSKKKKNACKSWCKQ